jgi:hypothetical protein
MMMQSVSACNYTSSYGLSDESKSCIRRVMGDKKGQEMIDQWEAAQMQQAMTPSSTCTIMPPPSTGYSAPRVSRQPLQGLSVDELCCRYKSGGITGGELAAAGLGEIERLPGLRERCQEAFAIFDTLRDDPDVGKGARLGLSVMGETDFPHNLPYDSLLERCQKDSRPSTVLYPALMEGLKNCRKATNQELVDSAEKMFDAIPLSRDDERPMEKAYAGMRVLVTLAGCMGEVEVAEYKPGMPDFFNTPLRNLKSDAQSFLVAQVSCNTVKESFGQMRNFSRQTRECKDLLKAVSEEGPPKTLTIDIDDDENIVNIGGVRVKINSR